MTQLQLVEIDSRKEISVKTVKAVSSSWTTLKDYCKETYGKTPNDKSDSNWEIRYEIEESDIVVVRENISKFN